MKPDVQASEYRFEKQRAHAVVRLSSGESMEGSFFVARDILGHEGSERVGELLNSETGFLPFELTDAEDVVLVNREHVVSVALTEPEARRESGYALALRRMVSLHLSNGERLAGTVRVYRPEGHHRLSDWTHQPEMFRYVETTQGTFIVNARHIVHVSEVVES